MWGVLFGFADIGGCTNRLGSCSMEITDGLRDSFKNIPSNPDVLLC